MSNPLLGAAVYDPGTLATASVGSALAMTALNTTSLRASFTTLSSGAGSTTVIVRGGLPVAQNTASPSAWPRLLLGCLDGSTVKLRMSPIGTIPAGTVKQGHMEGLEFYGIVGGLTASTSYNYDLAYGVEVTDANTQIQYGGPNDATGQDASGAAWIEVYDPGTRYLAGTVYDPSTIATKSLTSLLAMTALDTTNLRLTFTAPASGQVFWRARVPYTGASSTIGQSLLGILEGATVVTRSVPKISLTQTAIASTVWMLDASGVVTGLSAGSHSWDLAYAVQLAASAGGALKWGGPNNTTANDAVGGALFEVFSC